MNEDLLIRFLTKTCTQEELLEVEQWISADRANAAWLFEMERIWSLKDELRYSEKKIIKAAYNRFTKAIYPVTQRKTANNTPGWLRYAAAIIIVLLLSANIYQIFKKDKSSDEVATNIIEVPVGQRVTVTLADGTKVWLNSGSILSYPTPFDPKSRIVHLDGEGYFEVTADKDYPFVVNTERLEVKALGTKFNVEAYPDNDIAVSLLEGQLHIQADTQTALMATNDLVTWSKQTGLAHYRNKQVQPVTQWITGELMFVDKRLADIAKVLEKQFGVTIIIGNPELADESFTCRTQPNPALEQVLKLLENTKKLHYSIQGQTVYIK